MHSDAEKLVQYIKITFLQITPPPRDTDVLPTESGAQSEESRKNVQGICNTVISIFELNFQLVSRQ